MARVTHTRPHILLLDEPSNHLDMDAVAALIEARAACLHAFFASLFIFQPLQMLVIVLFHQCLAPYIGIRSSVAGFGLIFQISEIRDALDPL